MSRRVSNWPITRNGLRNKLQRWDTCHPPGYRTRIPEAIGVFFNASASLPNRRVAPPWRESHQNVLPKSFPPMTSPARFRTTWVLTALFAAVVGIGEGWHLVPGNGHVVEYPGGYSFFLGAADAHGDGSSCLPEAGFQANVPTIRGPEGCPICMVCGQARSGAQPVSGPAPCDLQARAATAPDWSGCLKTLHRVRARAPPHRFS